MVEIEIYIPVYKLTVGGWCVPCSDKQKFKINQLLCIGVITGKKQLWNKEGLTLFSEWSGWHITTPDRGWDFDTSPDCKNE